MKHTFWVLANLYGRIFGRRFLAKFHHGLIIFFLHALGYDNGWRPSFTGENWFIQHVLKRINPKVSLDIGASIGNYSQQLLLETKSDVYAFEPTPAAFEQLRTRSLQNPRLHAINAAVSNINGKTTFYLEG
ncbi:MAG: hypothetical protein RIQ56_197, partial [Candidatus Parcubacteria bacterium]